MKHAPRATDNPQPRATKKPMLKRSLRATKKPQWKNDTCAKEKLASRAKKMSCLARADQTTCLFSATHLARAFSGNSKGPISLVIDFIIGQYFFIISLRAFLVLDRIDIYLFG